MPAIQEKSFAVAAEAISNPDDRAKSVQEAKDKLVKIMNEKNASLTKATNKA